MRETDLHQLLTGTGDAAFVVDETGAIRFWNQAAEELFHVPAGRALHQPCWTVLQGADHMGAPLCGPECPALPTRFSAARPMRAFDLLARMPEEGPHWVNVSVLHATTAVGEPLSIHLARDVDARKRMENVTRDFLAQVAGLSGEKIEQLMHPAPPPHEALSERERDVARLLAKGLATPAIATALGISPATVRNHVRGILAKLSAHSRTEAVLRAIREKLL